MRKNIRSLSTLLIAFVLAAGLVAMPVESRAASVDYSVYQKVLEAPDYYTGAPATSSRFTNWLENFKEYTLFDINNDGVQELFVHLLGELGDELWYVFTISNVSPKLIGSLENQGHLIVQSQNNEFIFVSGMRDGNRYYGIQWTNGRFETYTPSYSKDYENYWDYDFGGWSYHMPPDFKLLPTAKLNDYSLLPSAGQTNAKPAGYEDILAVNKKMIISDATSYEDKVALFDFCGDAAPELFFVSHQVPPGNGPISYSLDLYIYTLSNGKAEQIYYEKNFRDGGISDENVIFNNEKGSFYILHHELMGHDLISPRQEALRKFEWQNNKVVQTDSIIFERAPKGREPNAGYTDSFSENGKPCQSSYYAEKRERILNGMKMVLLNTFFPETDSFDEYMDTAHIRSKINQTKSVAMTFDEAAASLKNTSKNNGGSVPQTSVTPPPTVSNEPSSWAKDQVAAAIAAQLVPQTLQSKYTQAITRTEFCALVVAMYEKAAGETIRERVTFHDTNDINVQKSAAIGVVGGTGSGYFSPNLNLTREQAAVMLSALAEALESPLTEREPAFYDNSSISSWAFQAVGQVQADGIMGGTGNFQFAPKSPYTREQSIITIMKLYDTVK